MRKWTDHIAFKHVVKLLLVGSLFCILFGEGVHLHSVFDHVSDHGGIHAVVHAHSSNEVKTDSGFHVEDNHQHEVSTATDIIAILTTLHQVKPDLETQTVSWLVAGFNSIHRKFDETPTLFDLPPPRSVPIQYHSSSFSYRGPPIA